MSKLEDRILINKVVDNSKLIDADKIVYNSVYFRFWSVPAKGLPKEVENYEFILRTINFHKGLTENDIPESGVTEFGYGAQFCFAFTPIPKIYFRPFSWHKQKYDNWREITATELLA